MPTKSKKRSAASEVLHASGSSSKVVLSASHTAAAVADKEVKAKKTVRLTRAKAASIRHAIESKSPVPVKKEKASRAHGVFDELSFVTGKLAGKTNALFGKLASVVKKN